MSRSYKKVARSGDVKDKFYKNYSNRKIRRRKYETFPHMSYKKVLGQWDICDYNSVYYSFEEYWESEVRWWREYFYKWKPFPDKKECYRKWYRWYKMK